MELWNAIKGRRSVRSFTGEPVSRETLEKLLEAAIWAPSGGNAQTWRFTVIDQPGAIRQIKLVSPGLLGDPAAVIAVCQDMPRARAAGGALGETTLAPIDAAMAAQNLLLVAHAEGLGTCTIASFHHKGIARLLRLPVGVEPVLLISVGWPAEMPAAPARRRDGVFHFEEGG
jgi:nitroreductase